MTDWLEWTQDAMKISGSFEGTGINWGNPVGNFDGAYLTCGLLGFTWKWNQQPKMITKFVDLYGEGKLNELMPETGKEYLDAVSKGEAGGGSIVSSWSVGEKVKEPYHQELQDFWSSPEMQEIQIETASGGSYGEFAKRKTLEGQSYYKLPNPLFAHFAYWFDQAVLNGTAKTPAFDKAENVSLETVFDWMQKETGYTQISFNKNLDYWRQIMELADPIQRKLWILAYLRSDLAREEFDTVTMCRRGSVALGSGYVNGTLRKFDFAPVRPFNNLKPNTDTFLQLARQNGQDIPAERAVAYKLKYRPDGDSRYWAIVDFNQHSKNKRLYVFDSVSRSVEKYYVAHGKGSDSNHDGMADIFLNVSGSNCSSLGIYRCAESYSGAHGLSLKLDGLESTNSNARDRAIVLHRADYVSEDFINDNGKLGRSNGCFVVANDVCDTLIDQLQKGSFLIAWQS